MNDQLPDVSITDLAEDQHPLDWVGMKGIDLPVVLEEEEYRKELHARVDAQVNLPAPQVKGIHMSRLYRLLDASSNGEALSPQSIEQLLRAMIDTHQDCMTNHARLRFAFDLLVRRPALITEGVLGWKSYPVTLDAQIINGHCDIGLNVMVEYSSTCPCSAALTRQLVKQRFLEDFSSSASLDRAGVAQWLDKNATLATPHSQRSEAVVTVNIPSGSSTFALFPLIEQIENALGTPLQTAVKRADEQAFAALNGQNLMFVEDAARRIQSVLDKTFTQPRVSVRHLESLHPHDAVAWSSSTD